ncbi:MAG TPA: AMP-binding protein [Chloroflexota bacterium]|nr:AMP-binding protein [Chloroflexota bacterium]
MQQATDLGRGGYDGLRLGDVLRLAAPPHRWGARTALIWGDRHYSYAELDALSNRTAQALLRQGVRPGERVAVLARNCPEYVWLYFALARLGAVLVPVNFWYRSGEVEYTLRQSGASTFLFQRQLGPQARAALAAVDGLRRVLAWGEGEPGADEVDLPSALEEAPPLAPDVPVTPATPHIILYTSGTTGFPKGAVFSQGAHYLHALAWAMMTGQRAGDVGLLVYPLFHTGGPDCVLLPHFLVGGTVVLQDGADPQAMLGAIAAHRVNNVFCVPTVWRRLLAALDQEAPQAREPQAREPQARAHDVSSVRRCLGSSDTLPPDLLDGILDRFPAEVYVTYGLTEAGCILTYSRLTRDDRAEIDSVGRPHPLVEVAVDAPPGEVGEVLARGPTLMDGYWGLEEQTAEALAGGWLHTGDLGRFDQRGALHLAGRAKDMIVSGGEKVYPLEVERLIRSLPGVADVALVGVPDPEWGESLLACVVRDSGPAGEALREGAIKDFVRPRLAGYKCPRYVEFVASLPVTSATNKVQKGVLRERFRDLGAARRGRNESGTSG